MGISIAVTVNLELLQSLLDAVNIFKQDLEDHDLEVGSSNLVINRVRLLEELDQSPLRLGSFSELLLL